MTPRRLLLILLGLCVVPLHAATPDIRALLDACDVTWDTPGPDASASMPLGNGDIGLNVWVEPSGDLVFYIGKTDAWSENTYNEKGLLKLGRVRVSLQPAALADGVKFRQALRLGDGEILVTEGDASYRVWVDANLPVIHVDFKGGQPRTVEVALEDWRKTATPEGVSADTILPAEKNRLVWYHRNGAKSDAPLANLTFGAAIEGPGLVAKNDTTLSTSAPAHSQSISIHPLTATAAAPREWLDQLARQIAQTDAVPPGRAYEAHREWWTQFWSRSWIFASGDAAAKDVTEGYVLQRFITACGGRGAYPIKFNGSIFVVDNPRIRGANADYRAWGGQYWFQNTRAMYWPRLAAGDFDTLLPLFRMYAAQLPRNAALVQKYYHHGGAYFAETAPFWGGLKYVGPEVKENWTDHYFTPVLELSMMMLDYYDYTGDAKFAKDTLVPVASAGLQFFDEHFKRDAQGRLLLDPDNSIEMYWKVHDPAPDIAGLRAVLPRMIALPGNLVIAPRRAAWKRLLGELPPLPVGPRNGKKSLLPYTGPQTAQSHNGENPELYAVYPFRLYGIDRPDLALAVDTFDTRKCTQKGCWVQDPVQAAMLGLPDVARDYVHEAFVRKDPAQKFPAFWVAGNDYAPDQDNGGNGENGLQQMLMQTHGRRILLLPAWPKGWNADFKLNAPFRTTVQGRVENGRLLDLVVTPPSRKVDVIDLSR